MTRVESIVAEIIADAQGLGKELAEAQRRIAELERELADAKGQSFGADD